MAVRDDFTAGEVLAAADLNDTFGAKLPIAGGKILQIVRATDTTERSTTSDTFTDVTGMSVTITPQKNDSALLIIAAFLGQSESANSNARIVRYQITDASNNALSGAEEHRIGSLNITGISGTVTEPASIVIIGRSTPATTSAVTYKLRFGVPTGIGTLTNKILNNVATGQLYAIEVSA